MFYRRADGNSKFYALQDSSSYPYGYNSASVAALYDTQFRTGSLGSVAIVYDIPKRYFGEQIKPKTFMIATGSISLYDDGYGSLVSASNPTQSLGNIAYDKGLVIVTDRECANRLTASLSLTGTLAFKFTSSYTAYENEFVCIAKSNEFNYTDNRTAYGATGNWKFDNIDTYNLASILEAPSETANSVQWRTFKFKPFVTGIGLYDDFGNLIAYGKTNTPIRMEDRLDTIFVVSFDT
jgi:hypothetical protein